MIDDIDKKIIICLKNNPDLNHTDIAKITERSQPTVTNRIKRLENKGFLLKKYIVAYREFQNAFFFISSVNKELLIEELNKSCHYTHIFMISGNFDILVWVYGNSIKEIEEMANKIRRSELVKHITVNYVLDSDEIVIK